MEHDFQKRKKIFFVAVFCGCVLYATIAYLKQHTTRSLVIGSVGASLMAFHLLLPKASDTLFRIHTAVLSAIGSFLTKAFMIVFFYVIFTPYGLLMRLFGGDALHQKIDSKRESYWITKKSPSDCQKAY